MTLLHTPEQAAAWLCARVTGKLSADSRTIGQGDGLIAWPGAATDARHYVPGALAAGAAACLVEAQGVDPFGFSDERIAGYAGLKAAAAPIAASYFNAPSQQLQVVAVTGTNGKTSTAWWLAQALGRLSRKCGVVGTLGIGAPDALVANGLTTPDPVLLQQQLRCLVDQGFVACALEASSIGLAEHRLDATHIRVAMFTNFTQDHLDYHGSMQAYWAAKEALFAWPGLEAAVINVDDAQGSMLAASLAKSPLDVWTVSAQRPARLQAQAICQGLQTLAFEVVEGAQRHRVTAPTVGLYNVSNLLGVVAAMRALGMSLADAATAASALPSVPGRLETLANSGQPLVAIDYAHTPDALEKVLLALHGVAHSRGGQLWCLFGCGGDRDTSKRALMAASAQKNADQLVVTSDNPRREDPQRIIDHILQGLTRGDSVHVQPDRALAIAQTVARAQPCDVVLLAGKGHETYQDMDGVKHPFSDVQHAQAALDARLTDARLVNSAGVAP
ncbi:MAG: UDP-N-acetylmuramoyl-L-alanyl-D-glutamate--2,6-diaminopimelate ligase [Polaromonas sp.]|nr:MAG: UDP-N-acetylmuramoyl-L-alanyl-D-glutamate--2,6-diaminopimelate ligase [Polaromonas sp.]